MLPIAAHSARTAMETHARSALPGAPVRREPDTRSRSLISTDGRRRVAAALRRTADRLEPVTE